MTHRIAALLTSLFLTVLMLLLAVDGNSRETGSTSNENTAQYLSTHYHALVVGVGGYDLWPELPNTVGNARDIANMLRLAGFSVTLKLDPSAHELKTALRDLAEASQDVNTGTLFYYAGHGETRAKEDGTRVGYIIPRDCPGSGKDLAEFEKFGISTQDMEAFFRDIPSRHVLMLFDASFSGDTFLLKNASLKAIGPKTTQPARQYIIAGNADEPLPRKSAFKKYVIKGLSGDADYIHDGYVTASELAIYLTRLVAKYTGGQQHPQYGISGDSRGDFIFKPLEPETDTGVPDTVVPDTGRLYVKTQPENASVKILNIKPKFHNGIKLKPGRYHLEVSAKRHTPQRKWIDLSAGEIKRLAIALREITSSFKNHLGMRFVHIAPGAFSMGSRPGRFMDGADENAHKVSLTRGYYMQTTEVTLSQFKAFVQATGYKTEAEKKGGCWVKLPGAGWKKKRQSRWHQPGSWESKDFPLTDGHPVTCVTWNDARAFIKWLNSREKRVYDLPTEAEWEFACRAGTATPFSFGACLAASQANFREPGPGFPDCPGSVKKAHPSPLPVANFPANPWKLHDFHGNVAEWCQDWYGDYKEAHLTKNPKGPSVGTEKIIRGGHWASNANGCRSARRASFKPDMASDAIGFRLVVRP